MEISRSLFSSREKENETRTRKGLIDGGGRRGENRRTAKRVRGGVRRSVPADRVLDAVKRTWNPSYFFTGRLFLFLHVVLSARGGRGRVTRRIHCRTIGEGGNTPEEVDERGRNENRAREKSAAVCVRRVKSDARNRRAAPCTLYLLRVL